MAIFGSEKGFSLVTITLLSLGLAVCVVNGAGNNSSTTDAPVTTDTPKEFCSKFTNTTCKECVEHSQCYFCHKTSVCDLYPYSKLVPMGACGSLGDMAWGVCWVNFEVLIIVLSVVGFLLITSICVCCCCCCRKRRIGIWARDQAKYEQQRQELKVRSDQRRSERQVRTDEIRRKYGLVKDDNPYQRFDA